METISILYDDLNQKTVFDSTKMPGFFTDLNLDQVVESINETDPGYNLKPYYFQPPSSLKTIEYRQAVFRDLEDGDLLQVIRQFSEKMVVVNRYLQMIDKLYYKFHKQGWFLEAILDYCNAVISIENDLAESKLNAEGLLRFKNYLHQYTRSENFLSLQKTSAEVKGLMSGINFNITIDGGTVHVHRCENESDYSTEVEKTFAKFKTEEATSSYRIDQVISSGMNHIEKQILDFAAKLFPDEFRALDDFCDHYLGFMDDTISSFYFEIQFYIAYLDFIARFKQHGLKFSFPQVNDDSKEIFVKDAFDIALANRQPLSELNIICNDFFLKGPERLIVVSGPNQGGKTTFSRMFGQLHFLAKLGCPVPASQAKLYFFDQIFTHFENEEDIRNLRGKLQDDLVRIHQILQEATSHSLIIMNEIFTSTSLKDARFLSTEIIKRILDLDSLSVCVSFIDELSRINEKTVSMVSTVDPENPVIRTFKIIRKPADGLSYALSIAEKHNLTNQLIKKRIAKCSSI